MDRSKPTSAYAPDEIVSEVKAKMALSGLSISEKDEERFRKVVNGERTADDVREEIYREIAEWQASGKDDEDGNAEGI